MKAKPNKPSSTNNPLRCQRQTLRGRCHMPAVDRSGMLCYDHARLALEARRQTDFSKFLTKEASGFQTASGINHALGDLYVLLAQGHITPRRAAVLAHICSLLLRTFPAIDTDKSPNADRDLTPYTDADFADAHSPDTLSLDSGSVGSAGILLAHPPQATQEEGDDQERDDTADATPQADPQTPNDSSVHRDAETHPPRQSIPPGEEPMPAT